MEPRDFTYWLKGFFEISESNELTEKQVLIIKDHLDLVFKKETPDRSEEGEKTSPAQLPPEWFEDPTIYKSPSVYPGYAWPFREDITVTCTSDLPQSSC